MPIYNQNFPRAAPPSYSTTIPVSSEQMREEITNFAQETATFVKKIETQNLFEPYGSPIIIRNHYYSPFYSPWYYSRPSVVFVGDRGYSRRERKNNDVASILVGVIAAVGVFIASYAVGSSLTKQKDAKRELETTRNMKQRLSVYQANASEADQPLIKEAKQAVSLKERICVRIRNSSISDLALKVALTAGLALTMIGGFTVCPPLLMLGLVIGVSAAAGLFFKWGIESDKTDRREARLLQDHLYKLKTL